MSKCKKGKIYNNKLKDEKKLSDIDSMNIANDIELERVDKKNLKKSGYDFVPRIDHWTSSDEQKIKTKEIENITDDNKQ